ncbi:hypothetical protein M2C68_18330 [Pseudomonas sp. BAgro211]|nr:hypothetical protein [Pseudomonas sp. BAgro211]
MNRAERRKVNRDMTRLYARMVKEREQAGCECVPRLLEVLDRVRCPRCGSGFDQGDVVAAHCPPDLGVGSVELVPATCQCGAPVSVFCEVKA